MGVGSIGEAPVAGCSAADATRLGVIVTGMRGGVLLTEELLANGLPIDGISGSLVGGPPSSNPLAVPADPVRVCVNKGIATFCKQYVTLTHKYQYHVSRVCVCVCVWVWVRLWEVVGEGC